MLASIQEIAELLGGQLCFGPMPPLDSVHQPVQRIVPTCQHVRCGDVVLWCGAFDEPNSDSECFLEEAFMRGALGVIANRAVAPWPGCFCLIVEDPNEALLRIAERQLAQAIGKRVLVIDPLVPSPAFHVLCQATNQASNDLELAVASDGVDALRWQLIGLDTARTHTLIHSIELPNSNWHPSFVPDVVVFTSKWRKLLPSDVLGARVTEFTRTVAEATIVCPDSWCGEESLFGEDLNALTYGIEEDATVSGRLATGDCKVDTINGRAVDLAPCWSGVADEALAAVAAAQALGLNVDQFVQRWLETNKDGDAGQRRAS